LTTSGAFWSWKTVFSEVVRSELAAIAPARDCDRLAELSALFHFAGRLHLHGRGEVALHLDVSSAAVARRAFALLRAFGGRSEIRTYRRRAFGREARYQLYVNGGTRALHTSAGRCSRRGRCLRPLASSGGALRERRRRPVGRRRDGWRGGCAPRGRAGRAGDRLREGDRRDRSVLAAAGASDAALALQERAVVGATGARANRLANADHANLVRLSRAAHVQLEAVRRLEREGRLTELSPRLREIAELRLRHPSLSLRELGANCSPPAGKAAAHRRSRALVRIANV
jgi:cell division protein WhiA